VRPVITVPDSQAKLQLAPMRNLAIGGLQGECRHVLGATQLARARPSGSVLLPVRASEPQCWRWRLDLPAHVRAGGHRPQFIFHSSVTSHCGETACGATHWRIHRCGKRRATSISVAPPPYFHPCRSAGCPARQGVAWGLFGRFRKNVIKGVDTAGMPAPLHRPYADDDGAERRRRLKPSS